MKMKQISFKTVSKLFCLVSVLCQAADSIIPESKLCRATEMLLRVTIEDLLSSYTVCKNWHM